MELKALQMERATAKIVLETNAALVTNLCLTLRLTMLILAATIVATATTG